MSLDDYFRNLDSLLNNPLFISIEITKEKKSATVGLLSAKVVLSDLSEFHLMEYIEVEETLRIVAYRYHYQNKDKKLIFRYDNAPHFKEVKTFPHHKHIGNIVLPVKQKSLAEVIEEILAVYLSKSS